MPALSTQPIDRVPDAVRRAQSGDVDAFSDVYRDHVGRVFALCRRMTGDAALADEITQEVFVRVWERIDSYRGDAAFGSWLHRIAVNVLLTDRRAEGRRLARVFPMFDPGDGPATPPRTGDTAIDLERALDTLPPKARQVFVLHDVEGWPHEEIADAMSTTVGTSKGQLHRARSLLRRALE
jgi:RNA polymerase sigma-70 factor (ECF subfamily)